MSENPADLPEPGPVPDAERPASWEDEASPDFPDGEREVVLAQDAEDDADTSP